jgi:hypothetical protein
MVGIAGWYLDVPMVLQDLSKKKVALAPAVYNVSRKFIQLYLFVQGACALFIL